MFPILNPLIHEWHLALTSGQKLHWSVLGNDRILVGGGSVAGRPNPSGRFGGPSSPLQSRIQKWNANFYFHPLWMRVVPARRDERGKKWLLELGAPSLPNLKRDQSRGRRASFYSVGGSQRCHSTQRAAVDERGGFVGRRHLAQKARGWGSGWATVEVWG